ncbi:unnamed protein product [Heterobilharzia americana]|nr:unnamed protein product [Heterobilharzia americana]
MNYQGYHENKMKSSQYTQRIEQYPNPYENHCGYSEVYYDTEKHQHILPSQYQPPAVTHYPHSLKLKRSCHNTKCRYCFPDTCNNVLTQFDLESKSSSSESASQIVTRNSVNNHNSYKKFLEQKSRPTCVIQEEIECDETQMDEEKGRRIVGQYTEEMIPVYREIRVNTPVVQHITPSNIIDNNLPVMHNNTYHTEDRRDVYWSNKQVPLSVCTNGNSSIGSSNYNNGPTVVKNRQRDSFNQSNSDRGVQYESITLSTDTARSSLITDPLAEHEISSRYAKFNSQLGSKKNMLLRNDFKKLPEKPMEPGMYRMTESRRLRLNPLTSCPEESQSIAYRGESILKSGGLRNHEFETQALNYNRYNHYHHCDQSIFLSLGSTHRLKKNLTHSNPSDDGNFSIPKRTMSHTNVYGPRSWNLRSYQGSESDLAYKREMSSSSHLARSGYSARRERLKQEREQELVRQTRLRQMAASSTGLHDHRHYQQQNVHNHNKQHYRSTSAVNRSIGSTEAFEEFETITLQPIGRGVQDLDSHVGSMTTLARGGGASSMIEGLSHVDDHHHARAGSRASLARQPFASTQCLNRQNLNHEGEHTISINRIQPVSSTPVQSQPGSRLGTPAAFTDHVSGVNNQQTVIGPTKVISNLNVITTTKRMSESTEVPTQNGWKSEKTKLDVVESSNMAHVNATARVWYRPKLSREEAISILRQQVPGSFLIRDSTTYKDAFGLAVKVATLPPKVTPKSDDLQSELVRHYLIEAVNTPTKGVRLKGFASEPVFPSLAALINRHTQDALALPCRLILPAIPTTPLPQGYKPPPQIVTGIPSSNADIPISNHVSRTDNEYSLKVDSATGPVSEIGSVLMDNTEIDCTKSIIETSTVGIEGLPFECVVKDDQNKQMVSPSLLNQGMTYRCFMLGSVDTPQWNNELCFSRAVDQLIPLETLTASECDHGISRVRYSDIQLHVSAHDGITIIDLLRRLFLRRHLPNNVLLHCGVESRKKEFIHPEHQNLGIRNPKIFGLVVRKGISECTCHIFSECDPVHSAESIVKYIRSTYPHLKP